MDPENDPVLLEARRWFEKFGDPNNGTHRFVYGLRSYVPGFEMPQSSEPERPNGAAHGQEDHKK